MIGKTTHLLKKREEREFLKEQVSMLFSMMIGVVMMRMVMLIILMIMRERAIE